MSNSLFCFGFGYSAQSLSKRLVTMGWNVTGTTRSLEKANRQHTGVNLFPFNASTPLSAEGIKELKEATAILISIPPNDDGDMVLDQYRDIIANNKNLEWVGYLSTTGVYGDHKGDWVDEKTPPKPNEPRSIRRLKAEKDWLSLFTKNKVPVHIFRLAGIYGPNRTPMLRIQQGNGDIVIKPGQYFNRIHVEDIVRVLKKSLDYPSAGEIFNVCDDEPTAQADVMHFAYRLLGYVEPQEIYFEDASLSEMARSFYMSNKRVKNNKIKEKLKVNLEYPTYRKGLTSLRYPGGFV